MQGDLWILDGKKAIKDMETTGDVLIWRYVRSRHISVKFQRVVYCGYVRTSLFLRDPSWRICGWRIRRMIHAKMLKLTIQEW